MLIAVLTALVASLLAASLVLLFQALSARSAQRRSELARAVYDLAAGRDGVIGVPDVASTLGLTPRAADELLRGLVDDETVMMDVDDRAGVVRFWYPALLAKAVPLADPMHPPSLAPRARARVVNPDVDDELPRRETG